MTVSPHPQAISNVAAQRRREFLAQADHERLAQQALRVGIPPRLRWEVPVRQLAAALLPLKRTLIWQQ